MSAANFTKKPRDGLLMFAKMSLLQAVSVNGINNLPKQCVKPFSNESEFLIEGVFQHVIVYVAWIRHFCCG
jgi:hypothetical protein